MCDVKLQDWPEGKRLRITYCHGKDEPRLITSYAGKWRFFEPVSVEIEPHPEGFYVPARDYDRQAAKIALLRARVAELEGALKDAAASVGEVLSETEADKRLADNVKMQVGAMRQLVAAIRSAAKEGKP